VASLNNSTLNVLLKDYEQKKYKADLNHEKQKSAFIDANPELANLNLKLGNLALDISKAVLNTDLDLEKKLRKDFDKLKLQKNALLKTLEIPDRCTSSYL